MNEKELKSFPECISKKLISLRQENISQDIDITPVLLFLRTSKKNYVPFERVLKSINEESFPFKAEVLDVFPDGIILCFDIFRSYPSDIDNALFLAQRLKNLEFIESVYISKGRGFFRYTNVKGREYVMVDTDAFEEFFSNLHTFTEGIYMDEEIYSYLYHNVMVDIIDDRYLKVRNIRENFVFHYVPEYQGQNPVKSVLDNGGSGIIVLRGRDGLGKTRSAVDILLSHDFDMIVHVRLQPFMQFSPLSAIELVAESFEFYITRKNEEDTLRFLDNILNDTRKKTIFIENVQYMDGDSKSKISKFLEFSRSNNTIWLLEGDIEWDGAKEVIFDEFSTSLALKIFKALSGNRKPDKALIDFITGLEPENYANIVDIFSILSFKKYLIFGEDVVYLSPLAMSQLGKIRGLDSLYEIFFESLSPGEREALLSLVLNQGYTYNVNRYFHSILRLARHGIVRVGPRIEVVSSEIKRRYLERFPRGDIKRLLERMEEEISPLLKMWYFEIMGEKRAIFRELNKFKDSIDKDTLSRSVILEYLLTLEPTDRERVNILLELKDSAIKNGDIQKAQEYLKEAISIAKSIGDEDLLSRILYTAGVFNASYGQMGSALMYLKDARRFAEKSAQRELASDILLEMASIYMKKHDVKKLIEVLESIDADWLDGFRKARYLFLRASGYTMEDNPNRAHGLLEEAYIIAKNVGDRNLLSDVITKMAEVELSFGQVRVAKKYAEDALKYKERNERAKFLLARSEFRDGNIERAEEILSELIHGENEIAASSVLEISTLFAYTGRYKKAIEYLNGLLENKNVNLKGLEKRILTSEARYLLRLGLYKKAWDIISTLDDPELKDEFYLFLMGENYTPLKKTPYIDIVSSFTTLKEAENLDSTLLNDYDYIDAGWMIMFNKSLKELLNGNYERAYDSIRNIKNGYYQSSLLLNLAKYIMNRGGDGDPFLKEAGEIAEKEEYFEVLFWIYYILGKRDKAFELFEHMFEDNVELKDNYINSRSRVLKKL